MKTLFITALAVLLCVSTSFSQIDYKGFPEWSHQTEGSTEYMLYTPSNLEPGEKYPVALFLHGCCGDDNNADFRNAVDPPVRMWHNFGENTQTIPTYIISPATQSGWSQHFANLKAVIDDLIATGQADPQRIYITGFSMGGRGTWDFINQNPTYFAAAMPMGMNFSGSYSTIKDLPIWTNVGELDGHGDDLGNAVGAIRNLNGDSRGGYDYEWVTGVNARFTEFDGVGHGVQWDAASRQDLTGWAYSKINDGNVYPNVFFTSPTYKELFEFDEDVILDVTASDADGTIAKVELYQNGKLIKTLSSAPYKDTVKLYSGDNTFLAVATDDGGKTRTATIIARTNTLPQILTSELPDGKQGGFYEKQLFANGNDPVEFILSDASDALPEGLELLESGLLRGVPTVSGAFNLKIKAIDEDGDSTLQNYSFTLDAKSTDEIIITNAIGASGSLKTSKLRDLELPHDGKLGAEINFSDESVYEGISYIMTRNSEKDLTGTTVHQFDVDEDATIYVAYEVFDNLISSTIPSWLSSWTKESSGQIVAQYRYFDVYSKDYSAGSIALPGADATANGVANNYFIMAKKQGVTLNTTPVITSVSLPEGNVGYAYKEKLSYVYGEGLPSWKVISGTIPSGLTLDTTGLISGYCSAGGSYNFTIEVTDANGDTDQQALSILVNEAAPMQPISFVLSDTFLLTNSGSHSITISNLSNHSSAIQDLVVTSQSSNTSVITTSSATKINDSTYTIHYSTVTDATGSAILSVSVKDNNNPDNLNNTTIVSFNITVLDKLNTAPNCDPIPDLTAGLNNSSLRHSIRVTGVNDGDGGTQGLGSEISSSNTSIVRNLVKTYDKENETIDIFFYPDNLGTTTITLTLMDAGGSEIGGTDTKIVTFTITVVDEADLIQIPTSANKVIALNGFTMFPNPANTQLNIQTTVNDSYIVQLFNISGKLVFEEVNCTEISTQAFTSGIYFVNITNGTSVLGREKIIIQH